MRRRRARDRGAPGLRDHELCRGPGNLARAMGITLGQPRGPLRRRLYRGGSRRVAREDRVEPADRHLGRRRPAMALLRRGPSGGVRAAVGLTPATASAGAATRSLTMRDLCRSVLRPSRRTDSEAAVPIFASATSRWSWPVLDGLAVERHDHVAGPEAALVGRRGARHPRSRGRRGCRARRTARRAAGSAWSTAIAPIDPRRTSPYLIRSSTTRRARLLGTAKPMPW